MSATSRVDGSIGVRNNSGTSDNAAIEIEEAASAPLSSTAGHGQVWVQNDAPNVLMYTDDAGTDFQLNGAGITIGSPSTFSTNDASVYTIDTISTASNTTIFVSCRIVAKKDTHDEAAAFVLKSAFRNTGGAITQLGSDDKVIFKDVAAAAWDVSSTSSGTNILVQVQGEGGKNIDWSATTTTLTQT